ncbi:MAG: FKBP-type peptidyl-prolyl cis-trans isomerase [Clostridia bacterium]|nr:FKBP-type peptidyl-prolyl cis-trans isomerase [Clostridia bacterium]
MRRIFAVTLTLAAVFCFASCDLTDKDKTENTGTVTAIHTATDFTETTVFVETSECVTSPEETVTAETSAVSVDTTSEMCVTDVTKETVTETVAVTEDTTVSAEITSADEPVTPPDVTVTSTETLPDETAEPEEFDFATADLTKYIALGKYLGIEVRVAPAVTVSEEQVDAELAEFVFLLPKEAMIFDGVCKSGDKVSVDYTSSLGDGETNAVVTVGAGEYIEGFEEGIVGMNVGETRQLALTYPDYYGSLAGQTVTYTVTLNYIYPTLNDAIVLEYFGYNSLSELRADLRDGLVNAAAEDAESVRTEAAWTKVAANSRIIAYPTSAVNAALEKELEGYKTYAEQCGITYEELIESTYGITTAEAESIFTEYAKNAVAQQLLLYAIARDMGMDISDAAYDERISDIAAEYGMSSIEVLVAATGQTKTYFKELLIYDDVLEKIVKYANFVETASN